MLSLKTKQGWKTGLKKPADLLHTLQTRSTGDWTTNKSNMWDNIIFKLTSTGSVPAGCVSVDSGNTRQTRHRSKKTKIQPASAGELTITNKNQLASRQRGHFTYFICRRSPLSFPSWSWTGPTYIQVIKCPTALVADTVGNLLPSLFFISSSISAS